MYFFGERLPPTAAPVDERASALTGNGDSGNVGPNSVLTETRRLVEEQLGKNASVAHNAKLIYTGPVFGHNSSILGKSDQETAISSRCVVNHATCNSGEVGNDEDILFICEIPVDSVPSGNQDDGSEPEIVWEQRNDSPLPQKHPADDDFEPEIIFENLTGNDNLEANEAEIIFEGIMSIDLDD